MRLGVIGLGVVGNAFYEGMKHAFEVVRYDKFAKDRSDVRDIASLVDEVDGPLFVCVSTPMNADGTCNLSVIEEVVGEVEAAVFARQVRGCSPCHGGGVASLVVKSTVPPGTTDMLREKYGSMLDITFNPEFLTEANPVEDFKAQDRVVMGGRPEATQKVAAVYLEAYPSVTQIQCSATAAEMVKYVANCFLAAKVSFANEIYQMCSAMEIDYNTVINTATMDKRLGKSHWRVPGHDGHYGFGLTCFPKDLNALIRLAEKLQVDPKVMRAVWEKNLEVRPGRDWEQMKGRAVL